MAGTTVLIVEDELVIRLDLADYFQTAGFTVREAGSPGEARALMSPAIDCVVTDLHMPRREDGLELIAWLAESFPATPVFAISGVPDSLEIAKRQSANIVEAFEKPFSLDTLVQRVKRYFDERCAGASQLAEMQSPR